MADDQFDPDRRPDPSEERSRRALRYLGIALTTVLVVCLLVVVGFWVLLYVGMSQWAANK